MIACSLRWLPVAIACALVLLSGCATNEKRPPPPSLEEIVQMSKDGTPPVEIVARLVHSHAVYRLKGSDLARLKEQGVPDEVLDYLLDSALGQARAAEARRQAQYFYLYGWPHGGVTPYPYWWYYPPPSRSPKR